MFTDFCCKNSLGSFLKLKLSNQKNVDILHNIDQIKVKRALAPL